MNKYAEQMEKVALNRLEREIIARKMPMGRVNALVQEGALRSVERKAVGAAYGLRQEVAKKVDGPRAMFSPGVFEDMPAVMTGGAGHVDSYVPGRNSHGKAYGPEEFRSLWRPDPYADRISAAKEKGIAGMSEAARLKKERWEGHLESLALGGIGARPDATTLRGAGKWVKDVVNPSRLPIVGRMFRKPEEVSITKPILNIRDAKAGESSMVNGIHSRPDSASQEYTVSSPGLHVSNVGTGVSALATLHGVHASAHEMFEAEASRREMSKVLPTSGTRAQAAAALLKQTFGPGRKFTGSTGHRSPYVLVREKDRLSKDIYAGVGIGEASSDPVLAKGIGKIREITGESAMLDRWIATHGRKKVLAVSGKDADKMLREGSSYLKKTTGRKFDPRTAFASATGSEIRGPSDLLSDASELRRNPGASYQSWDSSVQKRG